jgi:hypothetical protein
MGKYAGAVALVLLAAGARADEPPVRGRPLNFSEGVGSFEVLTEAKPTELRLGQTLTLTVRVTATGPVQQPPRRPDLRELAAFQEHFFIENLPGSDDEPMSADAAKKRWEFAYRLKPRDTRVNAVPSLAFIFYKPAASPRRGQFQTRYAPAIPLTVKPPETDTAPTDGPKDIASLQAPESVYRLVEGPAVLARPPAWAFAGPVLTGAVLLGMPMLCVAWYVTWRRRYPDAVRRLRQRRSQAARRALKALDALPRQGLEEQARQAAGIVTLYLRERIELPAATPTPEEAARHLRQAGLSAVATGAVAEFFRSCDAARFAPEALRDGGPVVDGWATAAGSLILTLEAEPCLSLEP